MVETVVHLWLLPTSTLKIRNMFFHLSVRYVGIWVHPYTVTLPKLGQILVILGDCRAEMMPWCHGWGSRPLQIAPHIHIGFIYSDVVPFNEIRRHISAPLHCHYAAKAGSDFGNSGWLLSGDDAMMLWLGWLPPLIASHLHFGHK